MTDTNNIETSTSGIVTGRVKWFNSKSGYGFLTVVAGGDETVTDVFVHHSAINVKEEQYKYLVQGEYVDFNILTTDDADHQYQAGGVTGVGGGLIMCETRNEVRKERGDEGGETGGNGEGRRGRDQRSRGGRDQRSRGGGDNNVKGLVRQELWNLLKDSGQNIGGRRGGGRNESSE
jgi:CspA family cold shock protein